MADEIRIREYLNDIRAILAAAPAGVLRYRVDLEELAADLTKQLARNLPLVMGSERESTTVDVSE